MRILDWGKKKREFTLVAFDATGQILVAGGGYQPTVVWDVATGEERKRLDYTRDGLQFHTASGCFLFLDVYTLRAYDPNTDTISNVNHRINYYKGPAFAPNEDWAVFHARQNGQPITLTAVRRFGFPDETIVWNFAITDLPNQGGQVSHLSCLPDGDRFLSVERIWSGGSLQHRLSIRSRADGHVIQSVPNMINSWADTVFASHLSKAVVVCNGIWLHVYQSDDFSLPPRVIRSDTRKHFTGIAFHPSGRYLAATNNDETVKLYDTTTWDVVHRFTWDIGRMRSIAFSPDGTLAAAGGDRGKVVVWDVDL